MGLNDEIADRAVRHAVFLERFKTGQVNRVVGFLNDEVYPDLVNQIRDRLDRALSRRTTQRLKDLELANRKFIADGYRKVNGRLKTQLKGLAKLEGEHSVRVFNTFGVDVTSPSPNVLISVVDDPIRGHPLTRHTTNLSRQLHQRVTGAINIGVAQGEGVGAIVRRIRGTQAQGFKDGVLNISRNHAATTVRTAVNHTSTSARELLYEQNEELIKGVQFLATLDRRTTIICGSLDGKVFRIRVGPRPPMHHQCRSTTTPVVKGFPPAERIVYPQWLKKQPTAVQNEILGVGKGKLFRRGKLKFDRFTDSKNRPLTLTQLEKLEAKL